MIFIASKHPCKFDSAVSSTYPNPCGLRRCAGLALGQQLRDGANTFPLGCKGYILLEVFIVISLLVGMTLFTLQSLSTFSAKNEKQLILNELKNAIHTAKMKAIELGQNVFLQPLDPTLDWSNGVVLSQLNRKTKKLKILYQWKWHHSYWSIVWAGVNSANQISFSPNPIHAISNGKFMLTNMHTEDHAVLILNRIGRISLCTS